MKREFPHKSNRKREAIFLDRVRTETLSLLRDLNERSKTEHSEENLTELARLLARDAKSVLSGNFGIEAFENEEKYFQALFAEVTRLIEKYDLKIKEEFLAAAS